MGDDGGALVVLWPFPRQRVTPEEAVRWVGWLAASLLLIGATSFTLFIIPILPGVTVTPDGFVFASLAFLVMVWSVQRLLPGSRARLLRRLQEVPEIHKEASLRFTVRRLLSLLSFVASVSLLALMVWNVPKDWRELIFGLVFATGFGLIFHMVDVSRARSEAPPGKP